MSLHTIPRGEAPRERQVAAPESSQGVDVFGGSDTPLGERHTYSVELVRHIAHAESGLQTTPRQDVHRGQFLGQDHRVALREDHNAGPEPECPGVGGQKGQRGHLIHEVGVGRHR